MKRIACTIALLILFFSVAAQTDSLPLPAYTRFPTLPPFKLLLTDSTTWITRADLPRKKQVLVMLFNPDCDHCRQETEDIISQIDKFKKITIVMATPAPLEKMKEFSARYGLQRFENIIAGRDVYFMLPGFYNIRNFPFLAFYDKKGNLIDIAEGSLPVGQILAKFEE